jgi:hypothetical protein
MNGQLTQCISLAFGLAQIMHACSNSAANMYASKQLWMTEPHSRIIETHQQTDDFAAAAGPRPQLQRALRQLCAMDAVGHEGCCQCCSVAARKQQTASAVLCSRSLCATLATLLLDHRLLYACEQQHKAKLRLMHDIAP